MHDFFVVVGVIPGKIIAALGHGPMVEQVFDQQHAFMHTQIKEHGTAWIVRQADGVCPHLHHTVDLALHRAAVGFCADAAEVMVHTDTLEFDVPAVDGESVIHAPCRPTVAVHDPGRSAAAKVTGQHNFGFVEIRLADVPQRRGIHGQVQLYRSFALRQLHGLLCTGHNLAALIEGHFGSSRGGFVRIVGHERNVGRHVARVLAFKLRSSHIRLRHPLAVASQCQ